MSTDVMSLVCSLNGMVKGEFVLRLTESNEEEGRAASVRW